MKNVILAAGLLLLAADCSPKVRVDQSQNANYSRYKSYAFMDSDMQVVAGKNPLYYNQIATQNVENTIRAELTKKGFRENMRRPDLLIGYHFFVEKKTQNVATGNGLNGYGPYSGWGRWGFQGWGPGWYGFGGPQYVQQEYEAGTVVVDMVDVRTRQLVWRGSVQDAINNPAKISEQLSREVARIVEKFPDRQNS
jgi:hypothetical protein